MSQLYLKVKDNVTFEGQPVKEFMCGLDRPLQHWFYQIWGFEPNDEDSPLNSDCLMGCSRGELLEAIDAICDMDDPKVKDCFTSVAMDLDPGADQYGR